MAVSKVQMTPQPDGAVSMDASGGFSATFSWKGDYDDLYEIAAGLEQGDNPPGMDDGVWATERWELRRTNANCGVLTVQCRISPSAGQMASAASTPFRTVYSVKSVRNDVSVLAYCSDSPSGPNRAAVERWMREPDPKLAKDFKYTDTTGGVVDMNEDPLLKATVPLVRKVKKGVERVIRFYPQLTIKRQYYVPPSGLFDKLSFIDTPPNPDGEKTLSPSGVGELIDAHQWLKVQGDCDEQQNGTWMRTESWIGILKTDQNQERPWDPDLYGENRWQMPHDASDPNQQDSDDPGET